MVNNTFSELETDAESGASCRVTGWGSRPRRRPDGNSKPLQTPIKPAASLSSSGMARHSEQSRRTDAVSCMKKGARQLEEIRSVCPSLWKLAPNEPGVRERKEEEGNRTAWHDRGE